MTLRMREPVVHPLQGRKEHRLQPDLRQAGSAAGRRGERSDDHGGEEERAERGGRYHGDVIGQRPGLGTAGSSATAGSPIGCRRPARTPAARVAARASTMRLRFIVSSCSGVLSVPTLWSNSFVRAVTRMGRRLRESVTYRKRFNLQRFCAISSSLVRVSLTADCTNRRRCGACLRRADVTVTSSPAHGLAHRRHHRCNSQRRRRRLKLPR